jgi:hypothetical protein
MKKYGLLIIFLFLCLILINNYDRIKRTCKREKKKSDIELVSDFLSDKLVVAYLHLYYDLPKFYFVPFEDLTMHDFRKIRIWDENDLICGKCENELKKRLIDKKMGKYWKGPYFICPIPGQLCMIGDHIIKDGTKDIWGRKYRMFYHTYKDEKNPTETEKKIMGEEKGVFIIISGGPDGILQSCARDKTSKESVIKTAPPVEKAKTSDFKYFDPFNQNITEKDPYTILSEKILKKLKEKAMKEYEEFLKKEGRL